jgi:AcrR family transcriptional regulator
MTAVSHNLVGQRLGRKGRDTRERILAATERLLAGPPETAISLSAVAREASLAMTTLYLYFDDLTALLLALLEPIIVSAEESYVARLRRHWPDESLGDHCLSFMEAYHEFWVQHSRILHLRNSFADNHDERMRQSRIEASWPPIELVILQMEGDPKAVSSPISAMATALMTGVERVITMATDATVQQSSVQNPILHMRHLSHKQNPNLHLRHMLQAVAKLLELGIAEGRRASRSCAPVLSRLG